SATGTVNVTVTSVNDVPVATNDAFTVAEDTTLTIDAPGVLSNDTDVDGDSLSPIAASGPQHGSFSLNADATPTYTPAPNYNGSDSFTYKANDGTADSNVATVTITINAVNDAPVAVDDAVATDEDTAASGNVLTNDTDVDGATTLTAVLVANAAHGTATVNTDGSFTYTPVANFNGTDTFTYKANDGTANSNV